jgi:multiple sugar transport system permease protein
MRQQPAAFALAGPGAALLGIFILTPALLVVALSFTDYGLAAPTIRFVGFANYVEMLGDGRFWNALANTALYAVMVLAGSVGLGLGLALMIASVRRLGGFYRAAFFLPVATTMVAMATVWEYLLHPSVGPVNRLLVMLGFAPVNFLGDPATALATLALITVWDIAGFNMVLFLAGLGAIPRDVYEAASVDGAASAWSRFRHITWPLLGPTTMFVVIITAIRSLRVFDTVALLTQGGPAHATEVILFRITTTAFQHLRIGYASTLTVAFLVMVGLLALAQVWLVGRRVHYT